MPSASSTLRRFDITIAGEINLDLILYGLPEQLPLDRELLATGFQATLGSSSAILAHNLGMLGARVGFATLLGRDDFGNMGLARLEMAGVDLSHVQYSETQTGITLLSHSDVSGCNGRVVALSPRPRLFGRFAAFSSLFVVSAQEPAGGPAGNI
jgi:sugar/nucleoside kinase (ribokinase family)